MDPAEPLAVEHLTALDPRYPSRLRALRKPPALTTRGGSLEAGCVVAIVGSRKAHRDALAYAQLLAAELAQAGAVVASGGALGIDAAAHRGAMTAGGRTWVVAGTGCLRWFPEDHKALFEEVGNGPGAMIWPFAPDTAPLPANFLARNSVLATLADALVVVQAGQRSGALHSAGCARRLHKPLWVAPASPWLGDGFEGSHELLHAKALPLTSSAILLRSLGLTTAGASARTPGPEGRSAAGTMLRPLSQDEAAVLTVTSSAHPLHLDEIALRAGARAQAVSAALLTLALENVVVEGPPGFFRRRDGF